MRQLKDQKEVDDWIKKSHQEKIVFFKHSFRCPISGSAKEEVEEFLAKHPDVTIVWVDVVDDRPVSLYISEQSNVTHQSPQIILFHQGEPTWNTSHREITLETLETHIL